MLESRDYNSYVTKIQLQRGSVCGCTACHHRLTRDWSSPCVGGTSINVAPLQDHTTAQTPNDVAIIFIYHRRKCRRVIHRYIQSLMVLIYSLCCWQEETEAASLSLRLKRSALEGICTGGRTYLHAFDFIQMCCFLILTLLPLLQVW